MFYILCYAFANRGYGAFIKLWFEISTITDETVPFHRLTDKDVLYFYNNQSVLYSCTVEKMM